MKRLPPGSRLWWFTVCSSTFVGLIPILHTQNGNFFTPEHEGRYALLYKRAHPRDNGGIKQAPAMRRALWGTKNP